ncbi:MAG: hypothetical protein ACRDOL_13180, partial [Streptosporangiaceae bacterium]
MTPAHRLIVAFVLMLAATIVKLWGIELGGAARGGWARGRAQAAAEGRRARSALGEGRQRTG